MQSKQSPQSSGDVVDLRDYIAVLRRRSLVIVVLASLGLGLALGYSKLQTPLYTATAKVLVAAPPGDATQNLNNVISMDTEAQVAKSEPIALDAATEMDTDLIATQLLKHVSVKSTPNTFILDISYWDPDPAVAQAGANAFAHAYLDNREKQADLQINKQRDAINEQVAATSRAQSAANQQLESSIRGSVEFRNAQEALSQLNVQMTILTTQLAGLPPSIDPGQVILPAAEPKAPTSPKVPLNAAIGLFLGLFAGVVTAFLLDRMDDRIHRSSDLELYVDAPVLAFVPHVKGRDRERVSQLIVHLDPRSPVAEAYRTIRASVLSMAHKRDVKVLGITSPIQGEGKSMTSANIAAALGQTDKRVLVISADIRKPRIHEFFGAANDTGLSNVLEGEIPFSEAVERSAGNIWVLAGGSFPNQPAELLQSPAMAELLASVRKQFDFVVLDCPPVLGLADCLAVLPLVDAVILVVQADKTRGGAILEVGDRLERVGVRVDAVVMNDVRVSRGGPGHRTYGYYVASEDYLRPTPRAPRPAGLRLAPSRTPAPADDENGLEDTIEEPLLEAIEPERPASLVPSPANANGASEVLEPTTVPADEG